MIPEQTLEAMTNGFGHMGSASVDLKTAHTDTLGASVDPANDTVTSFVLSFLAGPVLENFKSTGRVSYFAGLPSHESYQFKGQFIEARQLTEDELAHSEQFRNAAQGHMVSFGIPAEPAAQMLGTPPILVSLSRSRKSSNKPLAPKPGRNFLSTEETP